MSLADSLQNLHDPANRTPNLGNHFVMSERSKPPLICEQASERVAGDPAACSLKELYHQNRGAARSRMVICAWVTVQLQRIHRQRKQAWRGKDQRA